MPDLLLPKLTPAAYAMGTHLPVKACADGVRSGKILSPVEACACGVRNGVGADVPRILSVTAKNNGNVLNRIPGVAVGPK